MKDLLLPKDPKVCEIKKLFDHLQTRDLIFLGPIDVTHMIDTMLFAKKSELPNVYLWNQISDPNLGINDFLKVEGEAEFKSVVVDGEIFPVEDFYEEDKNPTEVRLIDVMHNVYKKGKFVSYFIAEGKYCDNDGIHFCLTPFNDLTSLQVLPILFGSDVVEKFKDPEFRTELEKIDLKGHFDPDTVDYCNQVFTDHFAKNLGLVEVPA